MKTVAILPAAGLGTRMGRSDQSGSRKQFVELEGTPILVHTIRKFVRAPRVSEILVAVREEDREAVRDLLAGEGAAKAMRLVAGGRNRQESVRNCLRAAPEDTDLVAVHDAVRPFVTVEQIEAILDETAEKGAVILAIPPVDTVKQVDRTRIHTTLLRERIVLAQTPQVFRYALLKRAFDQAEHDGFVGTDEASLVEHLGEPVHVMMGSDRNIKITRPSDLALARLFFQEQAESPEAAPAS
jgi:2-C-methyl-D-erythritol 4-phosphate cytidylyltransferase